MNVLRWTVNAARRTVRSLTAGLAEPDDAFARERLSVAEYALYLRMDPRDREHAVHVARTLLDRHPEVPPRLVRAALLHDVGKAVRPYRIWERVAAHLYAPRDIPAEPRLGGLRGALQVRVHHAAYGADRIRRAGGGADVARLVEEHDARDAGPEAQLLREVDELT